MKELASACTPFARARPGVLVGLRKHAVWVYFPLEPCEEAFTTAGVKIIERGGEHRVRGIRDQTWQARLGSRGALDPAEAIACVCPAVGGSRLQ
jgi:hypothetical protein